MQYSNILVQLQYSQIEYSTSIPLSYFFHPESTLQYYLPILVFSD